MPYDATFDARNIPPKQGGGAHPVGNKFQFRVTDTKITPTKDNKGGMFEVEFTSPVGSIINRYNLWNESEAARRIANEQLSALCHAVGIFQVDFKNDGAVLRGAEGMMDIGFQKGHEPSAEKPEGGYVELKRVYDKMGNEPGKAPQTTQQPQGQGGGTNVGSGFQPSSNAAPSNAGGWNSGGGAAPQTNNAGSGWNQQPQGEKPPWGSQ